MKSNVFQFDFCSFLVWCYGYSPLLILPLRNPCSHRHLTHSRSFYFSTSGLQEVAVHIRSLTASTSLSQPSYFREGESERELQRVNWKWPQGCIFHHIPGEFWDSDSLSLHSWEKAKNFFSSSSSSSACLSCLFLETVVHIRGVEKHSALEERKGLPTGQGNTSFPIEELLALRMVHFFLLFLWNISTSQRGRNGETKVMFQCPA